MYNILLVDDEALMLNLLGLYLTPQGYMCIKMSGGEEAINYLKEEEVDLILLDVMMPGLDGWETCRQIRKISDTPVIMLTAKSQKKDIIKGLDAGADDYITKPFDEGELLARIKAVLRRRNPNKSEIFYKGLIWNQDIRLVSYHGETIFLTPKEFDLLGYFLTNTNKVCTRELLATTIWGVTFKIEGRTIDSHVRNLRDKLRNAGFPIEKHLRTVWGIGYKWDN